MRYFVFVDTAYYPYVDDPVEADTLEEARAKVAETLTPGGRETIYLVPAEAVVEVRSEGPLPEPHPLLKLMQESNRLHQRYYDGDHLSGGFSVAVEPGSIEPRPIPPIPDVLKEPWG